MVFTDAYAASPLCSPTRASILTGQTPARHGITAPTAHTKQEVPALRPAVQASAPPGKKALGIQSAGPLDTRLPTLGKLLRDSGWATGHFGKWHLGHPPFAPMDHGFEIDIPRHPGPGPGGSFLAPWRYAHYDSGSPGEHIEDRMASEAAAWLREQSAAERPFYLQFWQFSVHAPFDAKPELKEKYAGRVDPDEDIDSGQDSPTYAAMVETLDDAVGTLLDTLDETGEAEHTIIVFFSDNGGNEYNMIFERDENGEGFLARPTDNRPLRGGKATIFEGGIRVPAIVVWPGVVEPGSRTDARIQSTDLYPSFLNALGVDLPEGHPVDGIDIRPALEGGELERPGGMITYFPHDPGVPEWMPPSVAVHHGDWKLIRVFHDGEAGAHRYLLYNLAEDIGETENLAAEHPEKVAELDALITAHLRETGAVVPPPNPRFNPAAYRPEEFGVQKQDVPRLASFTMTAADRAEAETLFAAAYAGQPTNANPAVAPVEIEGWRTPRPVKLSLDDGGALALESLGGDPWVMTRFEPISGEGLTLRFSIRSENLGGVLVFSAGPQEVFRAGSFEAVRLDAAGKWETFEVPLDAGPIGSLRIDPPGAMGASALRNIELIDGDGNVLRSWFSDRNI
ncbi:Arylsulfatase [Kiritimatiella glycovorans]|uniref:Arylsulfatase n=2 Tax=Kiritimatiella glycovorans TaxID=1307763 RepID=A0A0G3ENB5_9BACT|nr:Arylsulfatase [Kiritimatiella glycovorans]